MNYFTSGIDVQSPVRVLFVIDNFRNPNAGTEGQLFNLVKGLDRSKVHPHLLVFEESSWLRGNGFPCQYTVLGSRSLKSPTTWAELYQHGRRMRGEGIALAHVFFNDPSLICPPIFKFCGIRTLISRRDMGYWYTPIIKSLLRFTGRFASGVIANSQAVKQITMKAEGFSDDAVSVIYNGFNDSVLDVNAETGFSDQLKQLKERGRLIIGLVANIRPIKRIGDVIRALGLLKDNNPDLDVVVIGSGDSSELEALAVELGIGSRVHFLGACSDVPQCLPYLDIGMLSSESEGFSNSLVEYMRAELPVVCSAVGGNPEAVESGVNGFLYPVGNIDELRKAIEILANDEKLRAKMGAKGKEMALNRYSMDAMISAHTALYEHYSS